MKALLVLENGFALEGKSFTGEFETGGEVIFNTGMLGYQELLTDPAYAGQMVCMTYPLIGNYGINKASMQSSKAHMRALLVKECCKEPSNWQSIQTLPDFMKEQGVAGVEGIDTRALLMELRDKGCMRGMLSTKDLDPESLVQKAKALPKMQGQYLVEETTPATPWIWFKESVRPAAPNAAGHLPFIGNGVRLLVYDFGVTYSMINLLAAAGFLPVMVPAGFSLDEAIKSGAQAVLLSGGPGDPSAATKELETVKALAAHFPVIGLNFGCDLLGLALGAALNPLPLGHHGSNYPVRDLETGHVEICAQNHGFALDLEGAKDLKATHVNVNDGTVEGFAHETLPLIGIQYDSAAGPEDNLALFKSLRDKISAAL